MAYVLPMTGRSDLFDEEFAFGGPTRRTRRAEKHEPQVESAPEAAVVTPDVDNDSPALEAVSDELEVEALDDEVVADAPEDGSSFEMDDELDADSRGDEREVEPAPVEPEPEPEIVDAAEEVADEPEPVVEEPKPVKVKRERSRRAPKAQRPKQTSPKPTKPKPTSPKDTSPKVTSPTEASQKRSRRAARPRRISIPIVLLALGLIATGAFAGLQQQRLSAAREDNVRLEQLNASQVQQIGRFTVDARAMDGNVATLNASIKQVSANLAKARKEAKSNKDQAETATQALRNLTSQANTVLAQATQELDKLVAAIEVSDIPTATSSAATAQTLLDNAASLVAQITSAN